jgi:hypothetical protein
VTQDLLSTVWSRDQAPELSGDAWESMLSQARRARLAGRLARHCADRGWIDTVPSAPRQHLENALRRVERQRNESRWESDCIRRAIGHLPTPIVLLKGAAYVLADLPPARGRLFTDVDILVDRRQLRAVELALLASGWIPARLDPYDERYYRDLMHELPPLQHVERRTSLDVHHTLAPPTSRFKIDPTPLLASARPVPGQPRLAVLAPVDMVLHGVLHLMQDGDFSGGLRDVLDFDDLVRHFSRDPQFWPELLARARTLQLERPLRDVWVHACRLVGTPTPADVAHRLDGVGGLRLRRRVMDHMLSRALQPDHPDCDTPSTGLARWALYVRSHWLRMPWYQIMPHLVRKAWKRLRRTARTPAPIQPDPRP